MPLSLDAFRASRKPCSDALWEALNEDVHPVPAPRSAHFEYAEGFVLFEKDGAFWPVAWWYAPRPHASLESAEADLHKWYLEFA